MSKREYDRELGVVRARRLLDTPDALTRLIAALEVRWRSPVDGGALVAALGRHGLSSGMRHRCCP